MLLSVFLAMGIGAESGAWATAPIGLALGRGLEPELAQSTSARPAGGTCPG